MQKMERRKPFHLTISLILSLIHFAFSIDVPDEKRLQDDLLNIYNWTIRPAENYSDRLFVNLRFRLTRIAELDLKDQLLTLNVKIEQEWYDYKFQWDPELYGGIDKTNLPFDSVWRPDFELYNRFSDFEMKGELLVIYFDGKIKWEPSAIVKTFCPMELRHYPFDIQTCILVFGSWTYDGNLLYIRLQDLPGNGPGILPVGMILKDYYPSVEWDLLSLPGENYEKYYNCCKEPYTGIQFNVTLRRHSHFYLVNLVMPLVGLSYLSLLVFYLPADSGEKMTLCVSVLTSQVTFLLLMMGNIPVTSLAVPLLGKIIVFNMVLVFLSLVCTTLVLNVYYRKPTTHTMPKWVRQVRYTKLPKLLLIEAFPPSQLSLMKRHNITYGDQEIWRGCFDEQLTRESMDSNSRLNQAARLCSLSLQEINREILRSSKRSVDGVVYEEAIANSSQRNIHKAMRNVCYVGNYMKFLADTTRECDDWKFFASILDRIFLIIFNVVFFIGTAVLMFDAPSLYDRRNAIDKTLSSVGNQQSIINPGENFLEGNYTESDYDDVMMMTDNY